MSEDCLTRAEHIFSIEVVKDLQILANSLKKLT